MSDRIFIRPPGVGVEGVQGGLVGSKQFFLRNSTKFGVYLTHMNGTCNGTNFLVPDTRGPWGGAKRSNIFKFQLLSQFQIFLNQTLCVFSQVKDIKHIRRDFHSKAWVMPQGLDFGVQGGWGVKKFFS